MTDADGKGVPNEGSVGAAGGVWLKRSPNGISEPVTSSTPYQSHM